MAESLLVAAAESLIGKLASAAVEQASLVVGVHHYLQQMKGTMDLLKAFLLDADQKKPHSNALREWLRQINRIFSDADNIVDDFECEALRRHVVNTHGSFSRKKCRYNECQFRSIQTTVGRHWDVIFNGFIFYSASIIAHTTQAAFRFCFAIQIFVNLFNKFIFYTVLLL
ncbi:hypothetical protein Fmac_020426 [Flemingia macrophylla]|uniref:Disease resistance N-terminal domain-containing protein n=1 Tax=Flemingia macrophylla TaxID=520843 RepID=A0ABD1LU23_9FABA